MKLNKCIRCGQCMSVCPVYQTTFHETDVARGKLALLEAVERGALKSSARLKEILSRCLLCGACADICASQVQTTRLIQQGRHSMFESAALVPPGRLLIKSIRAGNLPGKAVLKGGALLQALLCRKIPETSGLHLRFPLSFFTDRATIPGVAWTPFTKAFHREEKKGNEKLRIGFFVGCGANYLFTEAAWALVRILRLAGHTVIVPEDQVCCGLPAYVAGDTETARDLARKNIEVFDSQKLDVIVTVCASCGSHLMRLGTLFEDDPAFHDRADRLAARHMDATAFLVEKLHFDEHLKNYYSSAERSAPPPVRVVYHDPCHLRIGQGVTEPPRKLLEATPGVKLLEAPHPGRCCGHGGDFNLTHFDLSMEILERRMMDFQAVEPNAIVTGCTGCLLQFTEGVSRHGLEEKIKVCHPLVLLESAIAADSSP
ncbi:MAG: (Fe-S)-binding protein [Deltaproteobacteria bacterium]|nr:(Fe-S)-binding protein [Deltaproteobacteria bacterium]